SRRTKRGTPIAETSAGAVVAESVERRTGAKGNTHKQSTHWTLSQVRVSQALARIRQLVPSHTRGRSRMRESRTYGSGRGACDETHVPTATATRVHHAAWRCGGMAGGGARAASGEAHLNRPGFSASCGDYSAVPKICRDYSGRAGHFTNVDGCARFRADQMDSSLRLSSRQFPQPESRGLRQRFGGSNRRQAFDQSLSQCVAASGIR